MPKRSCQTWHLYIRLFDVKSKSESATVDTTRRDPSPLNHLYKFEFWSLQQPFQGALQRD